MPRRNPELMTFGKVKKKDVENKRANMEKVRDLIDQYSHVYVFHVNNFRNPLMKKLKQEFEFNGRFFQGKVKPTMVALGKNKQSEYRENTYLVSHALQKSASGAHRGLFFTNNKPDKITEFFQNYKKITFAKTGFVATKDYVIKQGTLDQFVFSQEYVLKKLGLPVLLKNGRLLLNQDYILCQKGQPLKPEQCKLLELLNEPMAEFSVTVHGYWTNEEYYECVVKNDDNDNDMNENDDEKKEETDDSHLFSIIDNNKKKDVSNDNQTNNFLDAFVEDDSSDEDIDID